MIENYVIMGIKDRPSICREFTPILYLNLCIKRVSSQQIEGHTSFLSYLKYKAKKIIISIPL
jgi:hypothetical protein